MSLGINNENDLRGGIIPKRYFLLAFTAMVLVSTVVIMLGFGRVFLKEMFFGWSLAIANGALALLEKPIESHQLIELIRNTLNGLSQNPP